MSTPTTRPLMEEALKDFYGKGCDIAGIFFDGHRRFAGLVSKLEYATDDTKTDAEKIITNLGVTFSWILEVEEPFLRPVTDKPTENIEMKFPSPHLILESCRPGEVMTCCAGHDHEYKVKLTKRASHVLAIADLKKANVPKVG